MYDCLAGVAGLIIPGVELLLPVSACQAEINSPPPLLAEAAQFLISH